MSVYPIAKKVDQRFVQDATDRSNRIINEDLIHALNLANDPRKKDRLEKSFCKNCYYQPSRIAGQAVTERPCGICEEIQWYSSTYTFVICSNCAKENELCNECGADVHLRPRRKYEPKKN